MTTKERPILFSGPMVRALLDGRKTQTRRVVKPQPTGAMEGFVIASSDPMRHGAWCFADPDTAEGNYHRSPYGVPGDRLWVRETWQYADWTEEGEPFVRYAADNAVRFCEGAGDGELLVDTWAELSQPENYNIDGKAADRRWRPSIFMPRWASRLTLELTDVRVERVQDISEDDAEAEGRPPCESCRDVGWINSGPDGGWQCEEPGCGDSDRDWFRALWDSINAKRGYGWDANPWVWALTFRVLDGAESRRILAGVRE